MNEKVDSMTKILNISSRNRIIVDKVRKIVKHEYYLYQPLRGTSGSLDTEIRLAS